MNFSKGPKPPSPARIPHPEHPLRVSSAPSDAAPMWPLRRFQFRTRFKFVLSCTHKSEGTMVLRSILVLLLSFLPIMASDALDRAHKSEESGDSAAAREVFVQSIRQTPHDAELLTGYAEFLERYHDPATASEYRKAEADWKTDS